jgi:hypothetical protein
VAHNRRSAAIAADLVVFPFSARLLRSEQSLRDLPKLEILSLRKALATPEMLTDLTIFFTLPVLRPLLISIPLRTSRPKRLISADRPRGQVPVGSVSRRYDPDAHVRSRLANFDQQGQI